jgi:hypothetical protein
MTHRLRTFLALGVLTLGLAACGGDNPSTPTVVPPAPVATSESKFGTCFATRFDASPYSKATDPVPCPDLPPLSLTTKPIPL